MMFDEVSSRWKETILELKWLGRSAREAGEGMPDLKKQIDKGASKIEDTLPFACLT
jgi:hypothetical protein